MIVAAVQNKTVGYDLNFRVHMLRKGAVEKKNSFRLAD